VAQFGFWFFSELKINSSPAWTALTHSIFHDVIQLSSSRIVDYFGSSSKYNISKDDWHRINPLQAIGDYYLIKGIAFFEQTMLEQVIFYNKYSINNVSSLINFYFNNTQNYKSIIDLGDFLLQNNDLNKILNAKHLRTDFDKHQIKTMLIMLMVSYYQTRDKSGYDKIVSLLHEHYPNDIIAEEWIDVYKL